MAEPLHFQWQNEILCKDIYPMREPKLRDFLVYYKEVDLWKEYKGKSPEALKGEVQAYLDAQARVMVEAIREHARLRDFFLITDVEAYYKSRFSQVDLAELTEIRNLHDTFQSYFPRYNDVRKEKYFVQERFRAYEFRRRNAVQRIASQERRLENMLADHPNRAAEEQKLEDLKNITLVMIEDELDHLDDFLASFKLIEPRKLELDKTKQANLRRRSQIEAQLRDLQSQANPLQAKMEEIAAELARLKNPPDLRKLEAYCSSPNVTAQVRARYPQVSQTLLDTLNAVHKELAENLRYTNSPEGRAGTARTYFWRMREVQRGIEKQITKHETDLRNMPADWAHRAEREAALVNLRETGRKAVTEELETLTAYQSALLNSRKSPEEIRADITAKEKEAAAVKVKLDGIKTQMSTLQAELKGIEAELAVPDEQKLVKIVPVKPVTKKDIVQGKVDAYKTSLMGKGQMQLLEEIVARFVKEPERFPLWLQYMVVHFSGMRYASAHGSWADPKDLLVRLRTPEVEERIKKLDDASVEKMCREKVAAYEGTARGPRPKLATTQDKEWKQRIGWRLPNLKAKGPQTRRLGLTEISKDEFAYEIMTMPTQDALNELLAMKDTFPKWAWKQIVKLTPLRVTEVTEPGWEKLTSAEQQESYKPEYNQIRSVINDWVMNDISGWREEHGRSHELIVTRAVCNETAEHIQHVRGHLPPGGLTPKPGWYLKNETESAIPGTPRPYYVKATSDKDYTPGASVLWLRFVNQEPNAWQVAKAISTRDGVGLLPDTSSSRRATGKDSSWNYQQGEAITRSRTMVGENKQRINQRQWLRWIHEATVAEVAETADGPVILTFETALPDDDRGTSSIGMFKKPLHYFLTDGTEDNYNRSFVGYLPEGQLPAEHLEHMLDWNKILRRQVMTPAQLEAYRKKYIRKIQ